MINLLPQNYKKEIYSDTIYKFFSVALVVAAFLVLVFLILLYNSILYINLQLPNLQNRLDVELGSQKANVVETVETEINDLNSTLATIDKIRDKGSFNFPYILRVIGGVVPEGVSLKSISFIEGQVAISGHADDRSGVLKLEENLKNEEIFKNLESPLSNVIKERDVEFSFGFSL